MTQLEFLVILILSGSVYGMFDFDQDDQTIGEVIRQEIETVNNKTYSPTWSDLDTRLLPMWFDQAKVGILLHWGVYSVPAFHSEWFWKYWMDPDLPKQAHEEIIKFMEKNYLKKNPNFKYQDFAPLFKAENFEPDYLATTLREAGAKYVLVTSKHHDGYALFPSEQSENWNTKDVGPRRDLVGELALAVRKQYMTFGVQYSLYEWFNPMYLREKEYGFRNNTFPTNKVIPELKSIVNRYGPSIIRVDGDWEAPSSYWGSEQFLAWLYNKSPVRLDVVVNDRWGKDVHCRHGDYYSCVAKFNPNRHKWENAFSLDTKSWGYRDTMLWEDLLPMKQVLENLVDTVSSGGNVLINIGLTKEGEIPEFLEKKLKYLGNWLRVNGDAIYNSSPWLYQSDPVNSDVRYTCNKLQYNIRRPTAVPRKSDKVIAIYAIFFRWPKNNKLRLRGLTQTFRKGTYIIEMLGHGTEILKWTLVKGKIIVELPEHIESEILTLDLAWTLKIVDATPLPSSPETTLKYEENQRPDVYTESRTQTYPKSDALKVEVTTKQVPYHPLEGNEGFQAVPGAPPQQHPTLEPVKYATSTRKHRVPKNSKSVKKPQTPKTDKNLTRKTRMSLIPEPKPQTISSPLDTHRSVSSVTPNDTKFRSVLESPQKLKSKEPTVMASIYISAKTRKGGSSNKTSASNKPISINPLGHHSSATTSSSSLFTTVTFRNKTSKAPSIKNISTTPDFRIRVLVDKKKKIFLRSLNVKDSIASNVTKNKTKIRVVSKDVLTANNTKENVTGVIPKATFNKDKIQKKSEKRTKRDNEFDSNETDNCTPEPESSKRSVDPMPLKNLLKAEEKIGAKMSVRGFKKTINRNAGEDIDDDSGSSEPDSSEERAKAISKEPSKHINRIPLRDYSFGAEKDTSKDYAKVVPNGTIVGFNFDSNKDITYEDLFKITNSDGSIKNNKYSPTDSMERNHFISPRQVGTKMN